MPNVGETPRADLLNLLVVDDERSVRDDCREVPLGFSTFAAEKAERAYRVLSLQNASPSSNLPAIFLVSASPVQHPNIF